MCVWHISSHFTLDIILMELSNCAIKYWKNKRYSRMNFTSCQKWKILSFFLFKLCIHFFIFNFSFSESVFFAGCLFVLSSCLLLLFIAFIFCLKMLILWIFFFCFWFTWKHFKKSCKFAPFQWAEILCKQFIFMYALLMRALKQRIYKILYQHQWTTSTKFLSFFFSLKQKQQ